MLKAWSANEKLDTSFINHSADISITSSDKAVIKRAISKKTRDAEIFLVLVGEDTHNRPMVCWEIEKAIALEKQVVAVKIKNKYLPPENLKKKAAIWAKSFNYPVIVKAIGKF